MPMYNPTKIYYQGDLFSILMLIFLGLLLTMPHITVSINFPCTYVMNDKWAIAI